MLLGFRWRIWRLLVPPALAAAGQLQGAPIISPLCYQLSFAAVPKASCLRQGSCSHGGQQFGISQGIVWSYDFTCAWSWFLPLWHKNDSGEFKTGESMPMCRPANVQFSRKLLCSLLWSVVCQSHLGKMSVFPAFITNPETCVKLEDEMKTEVKSCFFVLIFPLVHQL